jgi:predicted DNA-binding ribbon-helix-helix protein
VTVVTRLPLLHDRSSRIFGREERMRGRRKVDGKREREHRVSIDVDPVIWEALNDIAAQQKRSVGDLVREIARDSLYVAIHVYIAEFYGSAGNVAGP